MSEMIERVARAIALASLDDDTRAIVAPETWPVAESYYDSARAAIKAMREPTDEMCEAAEWHQQSDVNAYQDAIDAALTPAKVDEASR